MKICSEDLYSLLIEPSGYCNAKCPHCPRYTDDGFLHEYVVQQHLPLSAFENGFEKHKLKNLTHVGFAGATGDPMMNPEIVEIIKFFDFVPTVEVDTNGSIRNKEWWHNLANNKNLQVTWSIDGLEDTNNLYRIGTDYKKIIENAKSFIDNGGNAAWKCIIFKHNQHQIEQVIQTAKDMGFSKVFFVKAYEYRFQNLKIWPVKVNGKHTHNIEQSDLSTFEIGNKSIQFKIDEKSNSMISPIKDTLCPELKRRSAYITTLGHFLPCCMMAHEPTNNFYGYKGADILKQIVGGNLDNILISVNKVDDILSRYYSDSLNESLSDELSMHPVCSKTCKNIIFHDRGGYVGSRVSRNSKKNYDE